VSGPEPRRSAPGDPRAAAGAGGPIPLGYRGEPAPPPTTCPPLTRWQGVAVVLFVASFPLLLLLVWWLTASR
jgi:hypothetical protein